MIKSRRLTGKEALEAVLLEECEGIYILDDALDDLSKNRTLYFRKIQEASVSDILSENSVIIKFSADAETEVEATEE